MSSEMMWKLVPVDPMPEMIDAAIFALNKFREKHGCNSVPPPLKHSIRYKAMLAAAPEPPAPAGEVVACRHRYRYPDGRVSGWIHRRGLIQGHPASDRFAALEVEPLYTSPPTVSPDAVRRGALEEAGRKSRPLRQKDVAFLASLHAIGSPATSSDINRPIRSGDPHLHLRRLADLGFVLAVGKQGSSAIVWQITPAGIRALATQPAPDGRG